MIRRTIFTLIAASSLLLFIATAIIWIVNHSLIYEHQFGERARGGMLWAHGGDASVNLFLAIRFSDPPKYQGELMGKGAEDFRAARPDFNVRGAGFLYRAEHRIGGVHGGILVDFGIDRTLVIPAWFVLWIAAIPPAIWIYRAWKRPRRGCCQACGYNLTGNTSGICPECGAATKVSNSLPKDAVA